MEWYDATALVLAAIGAINWGLYVFNYNLVELLSFGVTWLASTIYMIVALAGLYTLYVAFK